jgi:hypothetical protein
MEESKMTTVALFVVIFYLDPLTQQVNLVVAHLSKTMVSYQLTSMVVIMDYVLMDDQHDVV